MSGDWFSAGLTEDPWTTREVVVRAWEPGDGLRCSAAGYQSRHPCGPPIAVMRERYVAGERLRARDKTTITRVLCIRHLAKKFAPDLGAQAERDLDNKAAEKLAQAHWDEYQQILINAREDLLTDRLSALPSELRDKVIERIQSSADEEAAE